MQFVHKGQVITGSVVLSANKRQSYDVQIELVSESSGQRISGSGCYDLKNPYFRYTGQAPQAPPGNMDTSPSEQYWSTLQQDGSQQLAQVAINNGSMNGLHSSNLIELTPTQQQAILTSPGARSSPHTRVTSSVPVIPVSSIVGGISPNNFPVSKNLMIGDYATGNLLLPSQHVAYR